MIDNQHAQPEGSIPGHDHPLQSHEATQQSFRYSNGDYLVSNTPIYHQQHTISRRNKV